MAEELRDLIEKINQEGIQAAEEKARAIEAAANERAEGTLARARTEADSIIAEANERIRREEAKERALLDQAGRDLLLSLREEINRMLGRLVVSDIRQAMTPETLLGILSSAVRSPPHVRREITVTLRKEDLELLERHYLQALREVTEEGIVLKAGDDISGGFTISYDNGRSCYDYSDRALAEYIVASLKPRLNRILLGAGED